MNVLNSADFTIKKDEVKEVFQDYETRFANREQEGVMARKKDYMQLVNQYYTLVTDFYEYGWGTSFHFAQRFVDESMREAILRSEHYLALQLALKPGMKVLDVGCGIGGPMRNVARFSGATITGVNNCEYQIRRGHYHTHRMGLEKRCEFLKTDFMNLQVELESYDAAYAIEATCHAPVLSDCYHEIFKALKPGAFFACYEWAMTDKYDPSNEEHRKIKHGIEVGDGVADLLTIPQVLEAIRKAGFEIVHYRDVHAFDPKETHQVPWYQTFTPGLSISGFKHTRIGSWLTQQMVTVMEKCRIAPQGSMKVHDLLIQTARYLVQGGESGIFTPDFFFLARKPLSKG